MKVLAIIFLLLPIATFGGISIDGQTFRDQFGRQALFRGWNVSGRVKLSDAGFLPFKNILRHTMRMF